MRTFCLAAGRGVDGGLDCGGMGRCRCMRDILVHAARHRCRAEVLTELRTMTHDQEGNLKFFENYWGGGPAQKTQGGVPNLKKMPTVVPNCGSCCRAESQH